MSGGAFDHQQYQISFIADQIRHVIETNDSDELNEWGDTKGRHYSPETIARFREAIAMLRTAAVYATRIDWLLSDDDGEDTFHLRLAKDLKDLDQCDGGKDRILK